MTQLITTWVIVWFCRRVKGNGRGAHTIAMRDGGQPLHVMAEQSCEGLGLGITQLRKALCDVRDRTVMLAHLNARRCRLGAGGVSECTQRLSELRRLLDVVRCAPIVTKPVA